MTLTAAASSQNTRLAADAWRRQTSLRRLYTFLGLPAPPAAAPAGDKPARSADAPRDAIATASVWQARQAVYASSVARWRGYAEFVPEIEQVFGGA